MMWEVNNGLIRDTQWTFRSLLNGVCTKSFFQEVTWILTASVKSILNQYHKRINVLEGEKYDLEYEVAKKDLEVEKVFFRDKQRDERDAAINAIQILSCLLFFFFLFSLCYTARSASRCIYSDYSDLQKLFRNNN